MGTYTEIFVRCRVKEDAPQIVIDALRAMTGDLDPTSVDWTKTGLDPEIFKPNSRGSSMLAFVPHIETGGPVFKKPGSRHWHLEARSEIKNYNGEIEKFFCWILPYLVEENGEFIGFSVHENLQAKPILFYARQADE